MTIMSSCRGSLAHHCNKHCASHCTSYCARLCALSSTLNSDPLPVVDFSVTKAVILFIENMYMLLSTDDVDDADLMVKTPALGSVSVLKMQKNYAKSWDSGSNKTSMKDGIIVNHPNRQEKTTVHKIQISHVHIALMRCAKHSHNRVMQ